MLEFKSLYRSLEAALEETQRGPSKEIFAARLVPRLLARLGRPLGVRNALLLQRKGESLRLLDSWGAGSPDLSAELAERLLGSARDGEPAVLPWLGRTSAGMTGAFVVGEEISPIVTFLFTEHGAPSVTQATQLLSSFQYAITQHLRRLELEDIFEQARAIQSSLLPEFPPRFGGYDIAAASVPAERVGGDLFDFLPVDTETLAITVADASGHGFPAALQARDVTTGLRMGVERDLKITRTVEKLNRVIHQSGLVTRFVSLVFGELEINGNFSYINAGHPPPLLLDAAGFHELAVGGMILGPNPEAVYKMGFAHVDRGAMLVLYTDGVVERGAERTGAFGAERLRSWMEEWREGPAATAVEDLLRRLREFDGGGSFEDDVTVVCLRRPREEDGAPEERE